MRRLILFFLLFALSAASVCCAEPPAPLTLMVYMCGSDLESKAGAASDDLQEMMDALPAEGGANVLVMTGGAKSWQLDIPAEENAVYALTPGSMNRVFTAPQGSMGEASTLAAFLNYGCAQYPAQAYALILWDHGAGPLGGLCYDERYLIGGSMDPLTLTELRTALDAGLPEGDTLAWIGFDACLMASLETALAVAPYAKYMIASQETEPASGFNYAFLAQAQALCSGESAGRAVIDAYFAAEQDSLAPITLSCVDLSRSDAIAAEMDALFSRLAAHVTPERYTALAACRADTKELACASAAGYDLIDLIDLLEVYQAEGAADCSALLALLKEAIVLSRSNTEYINGLSVYAPFDNKTQYVSPWAQRYEEIGVSGGYNDFVRAMSALWLGESLSDWSGERSIETAVSEGAALITMPLTHEQAAQVVSARLRILGHIQGNDYQHIYETDDVSLSKDGVLQSLYTNKALYVLGEDGTPASVGLSYRLTDGALILRGMLMRGSIGADDFDVLSVDLLFREDATGNFAVSEIVSREEDAALPGKSTIRLDQWDQLWLQSHSFKPTPGEDGHLLPDAQWAKGEYVSIVRLDLPRPDLRLAFLDLQDSMDRYALIEVTDTQNNTFCSPLMAIENPEAVSIPVDNDCWFIDNEHCKLLLKKAALYGGPDPCFRLTFDLQNTSSVPYALGTEYIALDGSRVSLSFSDSSGVLAPGECCAYQLEFDVFSLTQAGVRSASTFDFLFIGMLEDYTTELFREGITMSEFPVDFSPILPNAADESGQSP